MLQPPDCASGKLGLRLPSATSVLCERGLAAVPLWTLLFLSVKGREEAQISSPWGILDPLSGGFGVFPGAFLGVHGPLRGDSPTSPCDLPKLSPPHLRGSESPTHGAWPQVLKLIPHMCRTQTRTGTLGFPILGSGNYGQFPEGSLLHKVREIGVCVGQQHTLMKSGWRPLRSLPPGICLSPVWDQTAVTTGQGSQ